MEKILVLFSIPIFLTIMLLLSLFVLAHYSGDEQTTKTTPVEAKPNNTPDRNEGADSLAT